MAELEDTDDNVAEDLALDAGTEVATTLRAANLRHLACSRLTSLVPAMVRGADVGHPHYNQYNLLGWRCRLSG